MSNNNQKLSEKIFSNPAGYAIFYTCLVIPTYIIPWIKPGALSMAAEQYAKANGASTGASSTATFFTIVQVCLFLGLAYGAHKRGQYTNKGYLKSLPLTAMVFDLVGFLSYIPFVPSLMHLLAIGMGFTGEKTAVVNNQAHNKAA